MKTYDITSEMVKQYEEEGKDFARVPIPDEYDSVRTQVPDGAWLPIAPVKPGTGRFWLAITEKALQRIMDAPNTVIRI